MKYKIKIIGFDGQNYWNLFKIEIHDNKEVYYSSSNLKFNLSFSRHGSGEFHSKIDGKIIDFPEDMKYLKERVPLDKLEGIEYLGTFMPFQNKKIPDGEYRKYYSKKYDAIFVIDIRNFDGTINVQPFILNPSKKEDLLKHQFNHGAQLYLYTASSPWAGFFVLNVSD